MRKSNDKVCRIETKNISYLADDNNENKKAKGAKNCVIKETLNLKIINTV